MTKTHSPPARNSNFDVVIVKPSGPHQWPRWVCEVHAFHTSSRGASNRRETMIDRASSVATALFLSVFAGMFCLLLFLLQFAQVGIQPVEALLPVLLVVADPIRDVAQRTGVEPARTPLCIAAAGNEPRVFE